MSEINRDDFRESFHNIMRKASADDTAALFKRPYDEQLPLWEEQFSGEAGEVSQDGAVPDVVDVNSPRALIDEALWDAEINESPKED